MFWRKEINLEIKSYSKHHIDVVITEEASGFKWRITGFYGHLETYRRKESWSFLNTLIQQYHLPWLCLGDFNEILLREEKLGGALRSQQQMDAFRNVVNRCGFKYTGYSGSKYTWCNQREGEDRMYLRLDRAFATLDWLAHFRDIKVRHLVDTTSDHCPLLLAESRVLQQRGKRRFHFEAMWTRRVDCKDIIEQVWNEGTGLNNPSGLITGLRQCVDALSNWSNSVFCQIPKKIQEKKKALSALTKDDIDRQNGAEISRVWREINELLDEEEIWWQQRSKVQWLGKGDRSTKYFHHRASERRKKNTINDLWNEEGVWCDSKENIASATIAYFEEIYTTTHPT